jgi:hypothetical protein
MINSCSWGVVWVIISGEKYFINVEYQTSIGEYELNNDTIINIS